MSTPEISGKERQVKFLGGATIDGAPIAYIVVLAAVVTALSFIPFSVIMGVGGSFPLSQAVYGLLGWVLGPIAGAVASGIGTLIGVFVAPYTAAVWPVRLLGALVATFAAGLMFHGGPRRYWWILIDVLAIVAFLYFIFRATALNGASLRTMLLVSFVDWSSILLFTLPTRGLIGRLIASKRIGLLIVGLVLGTWVSYGLAHMCQTAIYYHIYNQPEEAWIPLIPVIPVETIFRAAVGAVIGTGVIAGLRAIGLVKPPQALY